VQPVSAAASAATIRRMPIFFTCPFVVSLYQC
jgi:hypothetical protein